MRNAGVRIIYDIGNLGIIGVVEVIRHLSLFFKLRTFLRHAMMEEKPDVVVCVDYPGFNMKIAHVAKRAGHSGSVLYCTDNLGLAQGTGKEYCS